MNIKKIIITFLAVSCTALMATTPVKLAPMAKGDIGADQVITFPQTKRPFPVSRDAVGMNWALEQDAEIDLQNRPHIAESKGFWQVVTSAELNEGIAIAVTVPNALVRISPVPQPGDASVMAVPARDVILVSEAGEAFSLGRGTQPVLDGDQIQAKDLPFPADTSVFYIDESVGTGNLTLFAERISPTASTRYIVHVQERDSDVSLHLQTSRDTYFLGQTVSLGFEFSDERQTYPAESLSGRVIDPAGKSYPMIVDDQGIRYSLSQMSGNARGLWQAVLTVEADIDGAIVRRDARTAFAVAQPTARFLGEAAIDLAGDSLAVKLGIETGTTGRFEARAILFGTDAEGQTKPIAVSHSADWFTPGAGSLILNFDAAMLETSGLSAPYTVGDLRLIHQDAMSLLHRQAEALQINP